MWNRAAPEAHKSRYSQLNIQSVLRGLTTSTVALGCPLTARAQQGLYQRDSVDQYGSRFLVVVIVIGSLVVLFSLLRYRGCDTGPVSWGLLIAGTTLFPLILSGVGTFLIVGRVKTVPLCGSCHSP